MSGGELHTNPTPAVFGEVLFDCFEDGGRVLGGAPFNVAWHLAAFKLDPLLISRVGDDDNGRRITRTMQQHGMRTEGLQRDSAHATGEVFVRLKDGQPSYEIADPRAYDFIADVPLGRAPSLLYHGTLAVRHDASFGALTAMRDGTSAPVFLDVNLRDPWWQRDRVRELMRRAHWIKINDQELRTLSDKDGSLPELAAAMIDRYKLERIIVTCGAEGAFTRNAAGAQIDVPPAERVNVVDTVGAGDAFASVCILGIERQWPWDTTMRRAQQFAAMLVAQRGAVIEDPRVYQMLLQDWRQAD